MSTLERVMLTDVESTQQAVLDLLSQASQRIRLYSHTLDRALYDNSQVATLISEIARSSSHADVRILVTKTKPLTARGHRLLDLHRKIPTRVPIRRIQEGSEFYADNYLLTDNSGLLFLSDRDDQTDYMNFNDRALVAQLAAEFDELWNKSASDTELRRMSL